MKKFKHDGIMYTPIFSTESDSLYSYSYKHKRWLRKRTDRVENNLIYVGSMTEIDKNAILITPFSLTTLNFFYEFVPNFVVGYTPLGIGLENKLIQPQDILSLGKNDVELPDGILTALFHLGHKISEIHNEFDPLEVYGINKRRKQ